MFSFILDAFQFHLSQIKHVSVRELLHPFQLLLRGSVLTQREENQSKIQIGMILVTVKLDTIEKRD